MHATTVAAVVLIVFVGVGQVCEQRQLMSSSREHALPTLLGLARGKLQRCAEEDSDDAETSLSV